MPEEKPERWSIPAAAFDAMVARAERDYPEETCGLVFEGEGGLEVLPLRNIQNDLHRDDPAVHPRNARTAYAFDDVELARALASQEKAGRGLKAIYHSHPDHDAYFSPTDRRQAAPPEWGGEPTYPGTVYLVFSVEKGRLRRVAGFTWSERQRDFVEMSVERAAEEAGRAPRTRTDRPPR